MQVPLDKDGKPVMDYKLTAQWIAQAQASLPYGAVAFGSPLEAKELKVSDNQYINILGSLTGQKYWENAGVSSMIFGSEAGKSVSAIKGSLTADTNFISHLYKQYERFVNYQLSLINSKYKFGIKIFGDSFSRTETITNYKNSSTLGLAKKEYYASLDKEPWEYETHMEDQELYDWDSQKIIPLSTSYTQSGSKDSGNGNGGKPKSDLNDLGDAGATARDYEE
jgi:hypothetical protein